MNVTVEKYGTLKRKGGEDGIQPQMAKLLINNPSAQPGANIAPIDEIVRVSLETLWAAVEGYLRRHRGRRLIEFIYAELKKIYGKRGKKKKYVDFELGHFHPFVIIHDLLHTYCKVSRMWDAMVDKSKVNMFVVWFDRPRILLLRSVSPPHHPKVKASGHKLVHGACWWEAPSPWQHRSF